MRKGFTYLELIISFSISIVLALFVLSFYLKVMQSYKASVNSDNISVEEACSFIESQIINDSKVVALISGRISILRRDDIRTDYIYFVPIGSNNGNIGIDYTKFGSNIGKNIILRNIRSMDIERDNNLLYISIITLEGIEIDKCIRIKK
ncbi:MAG TPA: type II secretion system protein [Clostridiaceae bacterium]